jgi:DNA damage-binding protein 1
VLYVGSHFGDSQLLRINTTPESELDMPTLPIPSAIKASDPSRLQSSLKGKNRDVDDPELVSKGCIIRSQGNFLTAIQTFKNIAPVADAILVDTDGSGQVRFLIVWKFLDALITPCSHQYLRAQGARILAQ